MTVRERTSHVGALFQSYEWRDYPLRSGEDDKKGIYMSKEFAKMASIWSWSSVWNSFSTQWNCLKDYGEWSVPTCVLGWLNTNVEGQKKVQRLETEVGCQVQKNITQYLSDLGNILWGNIEPHVSGWTIWPLQYLVRW